MIESLVADIYAWLTPLTTTFRNRHLENLSTRSATLSSSCSTSYSRRGWPQLALPYDLYARHTKENTRPSVPDIVLLLQDALVSFSNGFIITDALAECIDAGDVRFIPLTELSELQYRTRYSIERGTASNELQNRTSYSIERVTASNE